MAIDPTASVHPSAIVDPGAEAIQRAHHVLQRRPFAAELLRPFRIVPDRRLGELELDLLQPVLFAGVVKGTP